jgi:hypothetical protein
MNNYDWKTKKEKILENARKDPFLKIEDLARIASTTTRYVRTILSEANMSLMQLRREYARRMENRYENICDQLLLKYLASVSFPSKHRSLLSKEFIFNSPGDFSHLSEDIKNYSCYSFMCQINNNPWCVSSILIHREEFDVEKDIAASELFLNLCQLTEEIEVKATSIDLEIEQATSQIAGLLQISPLAPIFRVRQHLEKDSRIIALMIMYFNYKHVTLSFSHNNGLIIDRKMVNS